MLQYLSFQGTLYENVLAETNLKKAQNAIRLLLHV